MEKIIECIKNLKERKITKEFLQEYLKSLPLSRDEMISVWYYYFPRPLLDRELPNRIMENRTNKGNTLGWKEPEFSEISILLEATQTEQYKRFMMHLMYSFIKDPKLIYYPKGNETCECCISGCKIYKYDLWKNYCDQFDNNEIEFKNKNFLAFGSEGSGVNLSINSLMQLKYTYDILKGIDQDYLNWKK